MITRKQIAAVLALSFLLVPVLNANAQTEFAIGYGGYALTDLEPVNAATFTISPPKVLIGLSLAFRFGARPTKRMLWIMLATTAACAAIYWNTPFTGDNGSHDWQISDWIANQTRYGMPFLATLAVLGALVTTFLRLPIEPFVAIFAACCGLSIAVTIGIEALPLPLLLFLLLLLFRCLFVSLVSST